MKFPNQQTDVVKRWVIQQVENISDADPDVLADYVLALLKSDIPNDRIREQMLENLPDFLREHTVKFVDDVFARYAATPPPAPKHKRLVPSAPNSPTYSPSESPLPVAAYGSPVPQSNNKSNHKGPKQQRKRSYQDYRDQDQQQNRAERALKSSRPARDAYERNSSPSSQYPSSAFQAAPYLSNLSNLPRPPTPPPGFPPFDLTNPMSSFMAMQAMFPMTTAPQRRKERCRDYDTKGFCVRGSACPYDHGNDHLVAPGDSEYDPADGPLIDIYGGILPKSKFRSGQVEVDSKKPSRAAFSDPEIPRDRNITAVVVEQIPEDSFEEEAVRDFFSQFGDITQVTMKAYKHLAIVNYETRAAAQRAFGSPKTIFRNRSVKVYWYRAELDDNGNRIGRISKERSSAEVVSGSLTRLTSLEGLLSYKRQQEEKQRAHEERQVQLKKMANEKDILARRKESMFKQHNEERAALVAKLSSRDVDDKERAALMVKLSRVEVLANGTTEVPCDTLALREKLAKLEAEAKSMGIDPDAPVNDFSLPYRGRARGRGFMARSVYYGRGVGPASHESTRGSYRGSQYVRGRTSAVRKLDNRPRRIAVSGVEFDTQKEEILRAYLVSVGEFDGVEPDPAKADSLVVSFKERWQAEQFMHGRTDVPGVGKVKLTWVASAPTTTTEQLVAHQDGDEDMAEVTNLTDDKANDVEYEAHQEQEVNLDVAGEDDWEGIS